MRLLSAAAALAYLFLPSGAPSFLTIAAKGLSVAFLALVALQANRRLLGLALALSSLGDIFLAFGRAYFLWGLAAFFSAHLVYITIFLLRRARFSSAVTALLTAYGVAMAFWLSPTLGGLRLPVFLYIGAICTMAAAAHCARYRRPWVVAGAILFLISDSVLAANRFHSPLPFAGPIVWITYYLGQCGIAYGALAEPESGSWTR